MHSSGSAFLVSFADKQLFEVESVFRFRINAFSVYVLLNSVHQYLCLVINDDQQKLVQNSCLI